MADISLVIINDNAEEYCSPLFKSIEEQITPDKLDIVFIDNCSRDHSVQKARGFGIRKIYAFDTKQEHRGVLYNKGLSFADCKYIVFAHSDIVFTGDFFNKLIAKIAAQEVGDFTSFAEYAPSMLYWRRNAVGIDNAEKTVFMLELFTESPQDVEWLLECSAPCFMVNRDALKGIVFDERYKNSFFEHKLLLDVMNKDGQPMALDDCCFVHYSIELHEKMKTHDHDLQIFVIDLIKYYKSAVDKLYGHLQKIVDHNNSLNNQVEGLNRDIDGLNKQVEDMALQLQEMPIALFMLKARKKLKAKINGILRRKGN